MKDEVLKDIKKDDYMVILNKWKEIFRKKLIFPFKAKVQDSDDDCPIRAGDRLKVNGIRMIDDLYGIIVDVTKGRKKYAFELCLLEILGENEETKRLVEEYSVWFCNR